MSERDEVRIKVNLDRYMEARSNYNHLMFRAQGFKSIMADAAKCLKAAGGEAEIEKYKVES